MQTWVMLELDLDISRAVARIGKRHDSGAMMPRLDDKASRLIRSCSVTAHPSQPALTFTQTYLCIDSLPVGHSSDRKLYLYLVPP